MNKAILHGYIICDSEGHCQAYTLATNRADSWKRLLKMAGGSPERSSRRYWTQQGFRCAEVWVEEVGQ